MYSEKLLHALNSVELLIKLWHEHMGHIPWDALKQTSSSSNPPSLGIKLDTSDPPHTSCEGCKAGKEKHQTFKASKGENQLKFPIKQIHSDLMGPMPVGSIVGGFFYTCCFTCDCSQHVWVYLLRDKDQTLRAFKTFVPMIEKLTGQKIKFFCLDRGGEFTGKAFDAYLLEQGIVWELSAPWTPQQNGVAEHMNQSLLGGAQAMLHHTGMSQGFWAEAINVAAHVLNHAPQKSLDWKMPYELMFGRPPTVTHVCLFGCCAWVINDQVKKWDPKSEPMIFVRYKFGSKAYHLWDLKARTIKVSANVRFDELVLLNNPTPAPTTKPPPKPVASSSKPPPQSAKPQATTVEIPWSFFNEEIMKPSTSHKGKALSR